MNEKPRDPNDEEAWKAWSAAQEEKYRQHAAVQEEIWRRHEAEGQEQFIQQNNLMYGGLIGIGVVMVQPFLTAGPEVIDLTAKICVVAFAVAIPLLAALILLNQYETYRRRLARTFLVSAAQSVAMTAASIGVVAGFWHILPAAGIVVLVCGIIALLIHWSGYSRLVLDETEEAPEDGSAEAVREQGSAEAVPDDGSETSGP